MNYKKIIINIVLSTIFFCVCSFSHASSIEGVIDSSYYSSLLNSDSYNLWSQDTENANKIYWNTPTPYSVKIYDDQLSGYLWGPGTGWISLNCLNTDSCVSSNFKVINDGNGILSGYAWGENAGWISFSCLNNETNNCSLNNNARVIIDSNGNFSGYAWSQNFGWIKFDCSNGNSCVKTNWRKPTTAIAQNILSTSGSSVLSAKKSLVEASAETPEIIIPGCDNCIVKPPKINYPNQNVDSLKNKDSYDNSDNAIFPNINPRSDDINNIEDSSSLKESNKIEKFIDGYGMVKVELSKNSVIKNLKIVIKDSVQIIDYVDKEFNNISNKAYIYRIYAVDSEGQLVHNLNENIDISIPLSEELKNSEIAVYKRSENELNWKKLESIKYKDYVSVSVDSLSYFMITKVKGGGNMINSFVYNYIYEVLIVLCALIGGGVLVVGVRRRNKNKGK